jgi:hypothetical protein
VDVYAESEADSEVEIEEEDEMLRICREATMACLRNIIEHLFDFLQNEQENELTQTYEDWIKALHPENVHIHKHEQDNSVEITVDHRFYIQDSEHRMVWNEQMGKRDRRDLMVWPRSAIYSLNLVRPVNTHMNAIPTIIHQ